MLAHSAHVLLFLLDVGVRRHVGVNFHTSRQRGPAEQPARISCQDRKFDVMARHGLAEMTGTLMYYLAASSGKLGGRCATLSMM